MGSFFFALFLQGLVGHGEFNQAYLAKGQANQVA